MKINNIEIYTTYNKGKSVVTEKFIRTLKNKCFKHMTALSKNVYFDVLDDIINKHNNAIRKTIKIKPVGMTDDYYVEYDENPNKKDPKFEVGDHVRTSKYKKKSLKDIQQIGLKKFLLLVKLKIQFLGLLLLMIWMEKKLLEVLKKKELQKANQKKFGIEKVLKRTGEKWKGYNNSFNSWINKNDLL